MKSLAVGFAQQEYSAGVIRYYRTLFPASDARACVTEAANSAAESGSWTTSARSA
jgi:hypothetical protein